MNDHDGEDANRGAEGEAEPEDRPRRAEEDFVHGGHRQRSYNP
jgi:hypothetical protein